jgi:uncharacterized protein
MHTPEPTPPPGALGRDPTTTVEDALRISVRFNESTRWRGKSLAAALLDRCEQGEFRAAILFRGGEGLESSGVWSSDRFETRSYDLPLLMTAVDEAPRIAGLAADLRVGFPADVALEHCRLLTSDAVASALHESEKPVKFTIYCNGAAKIGQRYAASAIVDYLWLRGFSGSTVLPGLDAVFDGVRESVRTSVPVAIVSVDAARKVLASLQLLPIPTNATLTVSPVRVLKRNGTQEASVLTEHEQLGDHFEPWQRLTIYTSQNDRIGRRSFRSELVGRLRKVKASGATVFVGVSGYGGGHEPRHPSRFSLSSRPVVTEIVDRPSEIARIWPLIDEATSEVGLVTSEAIFYAAVPRRA